MFTPINIDLMMEKPLALCNPKPNCSSSLIILSVGHKDTENHVYIAYQIYFNGGES